MPVVSNTSPILNLAIINKLDLLRILFEEIIIPPAVADELLLNTNKPGIPAIKTALNESWIHVVGFVDSGLCRILERDLDKGESEAIALAQYQGVQTVLIDEHDGRLVAKAMGLFPIGVLGVLLAAKRMCVIESVSDAVQMLKKEAGFYISEFLFEKLLSEAGEI